jgi:hypothetical protein
MDLNRQCTEKKERERKEKQIKMYILHDNGFEKGRKKDE